MAVAVASVARSRELNAAILRDERGLRELGRVIEVAELRGCERFLQIANLGQRRTRDGKGELIGVARRLAPDLIDFQIERNGALADLQSPCRMEHEGGLAGIELAQHDQQLQIRRQCGLPVRGLLRLGGQNRHDLDRRQRACWDCRPR